MSRVVTPARDDGTPYIPSLGDIIDLTGAEDGMRSPIFLQRELPQKTTNRVQQGASVTKPAGAHVPLAGMDVSIGTGFTAPTTVAPQRLPGYRGQTSSAVSQGVSMQYGGGGALMQPQGKIRQFHDDTIHRQELGKWKTQGQGGVVHQRDTAQLATDRMSIARLYESYREPHAKVDEGLAAQGSQEGMQTSSAPRAAPTNVSKDTSGKAPEEAGESRVEIVPWMLLKRDDLELHVGAFAESYPQEFAQIYEESFGSSQLVVKKIEEFSTEQLVYLYRSCMDRFPKLFQPKRNCTTRLPKPPPPPRQVSSRAAAVFIRKFAQVFPVDFSLIFPHSNFATELVRLNQHMGYVAPAVLSVAAKVYLQEFATRFPKEYGAVIDSPHFSAAQRKNFGPSGPISGSFINSANVGIHPVPKSVPLVPSMEQFKTSLDDVLTRKGLLLWQRMRSKSVVKPVPISYSSPQHVQNDLSDPLTPEFRGELKEDSSDLLCDYIDKMKLQSFLHFLMVFREALEFCDLFRNPSEVEEAILNPSGEHFVLLVDRLMKGAPARRGVLRNEKQVLRALCDDVVARPSVYSSETELFLVPPDGGFVLNGIQSLSSTTIEVRIAILHALACGATEANKNIRNSIQSAHNYSLFRLKPIGTDRTGRYYYHLRGRLDGNCCSPIILEGNEQSELRAVTKSVVGMFHLSSELGSSKYWTEIVTSQRLRSAARHVQANLRYWKAKEGQAEKESRNLVPDDSDKEEQGSSDVKEAHKADQQHIIESQEYLALDGTHPEVFSEQRESVSVQPVASAMDTRDKLKTLDQPGKQDSAASDSDDGSVSPLKKGVELNGVMKRSYTDSSSDSDFDPGQVTEGESVDNEGYEIVCPRVTSFSRGTTRLRKQDPPSANKEIGEKSSLQLHMGEAATGTVQEKNHSDNKQADAVEPLSSSEDERNKEGILRSSQYAPTTAKLTGRPAGGKIVGLGIPFGKTTSSRGGNSGLGEALVGNMRTRASKETKEETEEGRSTRAGIHRGKRRKLRVELGTRDTSGTGEGEWSTKKLRGRTQRQLELAQRSPRDEEDGRVGERSMKFRMLSWDGDETDRDEDEDWLPGRDGLYVRMNSSSAGVERSRARRKLRKSSIDDVDGTRGPLNVGASAPVERRSEQEHVKKDMFSSLLGEGEVDNEGYESGRYKGYMTEERKKQISIMEGKDIFDDEYYEKLKRDGLLKRSASASVHGADYATRVLIKKLGRKVEDVQDGEKNADIAEDVLVSDVELSSSDSGDEKDYRPKSSSDAAETDVSRRKTLALLNTIRKARKSSTRNDRAVKGISQNLKSKTLKRTIDRPGELENKGTVVINFLSSPKKSKFETWEKAVKNPKGVKSKETTSVESQSFKKEESKCLERVVTSKLPFSLSGSKNGTGNDGEHEIEDVIEVMPLQGDDEKDPDEGKAVGIKMNLVDDNIDEETIEEFDMTQADDDDEAETKGVTSTTSKLGHFLQSQTTTSDQI